MQSKISDLLQLAPLEPIDQQYIESRMRHIYYSFDGVEPNRNCSCMIVVDNGQSVNATAESGGVFDMNTKQKEAYDKACAILIGTYGWLQAQKAAILAVTTVDTITPQNTANATAPIQGE